MNKIKWLVQDVGIKMANIEDNFYALQRIGYSFNNFGVIANEHLISNLENILFDPDEHFIIRGGVKILSLLEQSSSLGQLNPYLTAEQLLYNDIYTQHLKNAVFYNEQTFDQAYYGQLDLPLLNANATLYPVIDNMNLSFKENMFLKPSKDLKAFTAGILEAGQTIGDFILNQSYQMTYLTEQAVIAPCKTITSEYRFFVVDQQVITGSRYRLGNQTNVSDIVPSNLLEAAKEYAKLYQPHAIFTMDLAETPEGIFIVEYNCWNASGLYRTDVMKIFNTVHEYQETLNYQKKPSLS